MNQDLQTVLDALVQVDALIEHQFTGTRKGMTALQNACDAASEAITIVRGMMQVEPVGEVSGNDWSCALLYKDMEPGSPVYAAPVAPQAVPAGWKLVPVEPTEAMEIAGAMAHEQSKCHDNIGPIQDAWQAMIKEAPAAPPEVDSYDLSVLDELCATLTYRSPSRHNALSNLLKSYRAIAAAPAVKGDV